MTLVTYARDCSYPRYGLYIVTQNLADPEVKDLPWEVSLKKKSTVRDKSYDFRLPKSSTSFSLMAHKDCSNVSIP